MKASNMKFLLRARNLFKISRNNFCSSKVQAESALNQIQEYKDAQSLMSKGSFSAASEYLLRVVNILEISGQQQNPIYNHLLQIAGNNYFNLGDMKGIELVSSKYQSILSDSSSNSYLNAYRNAFLSSLHFDLNKAESHLNKLKATSEYSLFAGVRGGNQRTELSLQILQGKSQLAISTLNELIQKLESEQKTDISAQLLWKAYNNLGVANWQEEFPNFNHLNVTEKVIKQKEPNLKNALLFKKALLINNQGMKGNNIYDLFDKTEEVIPKENIPKIDYYFSAPGSGTVLRAITDYLFDAHHSKRHEHTLWVKFYLKYHEFNDRNTLYRPLVSIAHHSGVSEMLLKSEGLFNTARTMLNDDKTIEKWLCEYFFACMVAQIDKREDEAASMKKIARHECQKFPNWQQWQLYLALPKVSFEQQQQQQQKQ